MIPFACNFFYAEIKASGKVLALGIWRLPGCQHQLILSCSFAVYHFTVTSYLTKKVNFSNKKKFTGTALNKR
jgi:hypothetical protein